MIEKMFFFENGNYAAFEGSEQVSPEQGNAWIGILQDKLDRKVIGPKTTVRMPGWWTPDHQGQEWTVQQLIDVGHLKAAK